MYKIELFGEYLKKYRKIKNMSLEEVGKAIFKTKATISKYENNEISPDYRTVLELCNLLDIDINLIFKDLTNEQNYMAFHYQTLHIYYVSDNKLIYSILKLNAHNNLCSFYNGSKSNNKNIAYYYEGTYEYLENIMYINLKNITSSSLNMERVKITISFPLSNTVNLYNGFIDGLTPNFIPVVKKAIFSTDKLKNKENLISKLKLNKNDCKEIMVHHALLLNAKIYDEFFYDSLI